MRAARGALALLAFGILPLIGVAAAEAEIYKYVDPQGNVHFQDHPPGGAEKVRDLEVRKSSPPRPKAAAPAPPAAAGSPGRAAAAGSPGEAADAPKGVIDVELFGVSWCPWCRKAREFFQSRGVPYTYYDIEKDPVAAARKKELGSSKGVPFALVNGVRIQGYSPQGYTSALLVPLPFKP